MTPDQLFASLAFWVSFAILSWIVFRLWPNHRTDRFRQEMFDVRDKLFDYAATGNIAFSDPAYRLLRQNMNGFIRYAHHITFFRLMCNLVRWNLHQQYPLSWTANFQEALNDVHDESVRKALEKLHLVALENVAARLATGSPVLMVAVSVVGVLLAVSSGVTATNRVVAKVFDYRFLDEQAARAARA